MPKTTRDRCITPSFSPSTRHRRKLMDGEPTDFTNTDAIVTDPLKHQTNGRGLGFVDGIARDAAALMFADIAVAIGRPGQNTDPTFMRGVAFAAPTAFQDLGTLVFGHHALHLKQ